jgi:hypothetical protein
MGEKALSSETSQQNSILRKRDGILVFSKFCPREAGKRSHLLANLNYYPGRIYFQAVKKRRDIWQQFSNEESGTITQQHHKFQQQLF